MDPDPGSSDLVISEMMINATGEDSGKEWFEIKNVSGKDLNLSHSAIQIDDKTIPILFPLAKIPADGTVVFTADSPSAPPEDGVVHLGDDLRLSNASGRLAIVVPSDEAETPPTIIDEVSYVDDDMWPYREGVSMSLDRVQDNPLSNDVPLAWCMSITQGSTWFERHSRGVENPRCLSMQTNPTIDDSIDAYELDDDDTRVYRIDVEANPADIALIDAVRSKDIEDDPGTFPATITTLERRRRPYRFHRAPWPNQSPLASKES